MRIVTHIRCESFIIIWCTVFILYRAAQYHGTRRRPADRRTPRRIRSINVRAKYTASFLSLRPRICPTRNFIRFTYYIIVCTYIGTNSIVIFRNPFFYSSNRWILRYRHTHPSYPRTVCRLTFKQTRHAVMAVDLMKF
jgi:hypothetical protein